MSSIKLIKIKKVGDRRLFNLAVKGNESYIANQIVVHNCRSILTPITTMEVEREGGIETDQITDVPRAKGFEYSAEYNIYRND